jgi:type IV secretory pathway VirB9-like protein
MKRTLKSVVMVLLTSFLLPGPSQAKHAQRRVKSSPTLRSLSADTEAGGKTIQYGTKDVVKLNTKVRFTTLIVLPESEQILDYACGDKEFWIVNGNNNFAYIKPAKEGATTNLNLITQSGNIYSFVLVEVSNLPNAQPDLKVFIEPKEQSMISVAAQPRFVPATEVDSCRQQLEGQKEEVRRVQQEAQRAIESKIDKFLSEAKFTYRFDLDKKPFDIRAIWHDSKFTYIVGQPEETPTLYEIRDGKPNLVNFEYKTGVYIAEKVIDRGYLVIGKSRLQFVRQENP